MPPTPRLLMRVCTEGGCIISQGANRVGADRHSKGRTSPRVRSLNFGERPYIAGGILGLGLMIVGGEGCEGCGGRSVFLTSVPR